MDVAGHIQGSIPDWPVFSKFVEGVRNPGVVIEALGVNWKGCIWGQKFATPSARHAGHDGATLASRTSLCAKARAQNPERWSGKTRNWQTAGHVWLNPENEISAPEIRDAA
jgi:putative transposase